MKKSVGDFNEMSLKELVALRGIGRQTAQRIIARREKYPYKTVKDLLQIRGLGKSTLARLGLKIPKRKPKESQIKEMVSFVSNYKLDRNKPSFNESSNNKKVSFWQDCVKDTCHRPDLVKSASRCNECPFVLICECRLRGFVSENGKKRNLPTKKTVKDMLENIHMYKHFQHKDGSPNLEMINLPSDLFDD